VSEAIKQAYNRVTYSINASIQRSEWQRLATLQCADERDRASIRYNGWQLIMQSTEVPAYNILSGELQYAECSSTCIQMSGVQCAVQ
jgi:hypothetical protein